MAIIIEKVKIRAIKFLLKINFVQAKKIKNKDILKKIKSIIFAKLKDFKWLKKFFIKEFLTIFFKLNYIFILSNVILLVFFY